MHYVVDSLLKPHFQRLCIVATLLATSSLAWGEVVQASAVVAEEPREVPGFIIVAIIFNLTLAAVILLLLRKEWKKRKMLSKLTLSSKPEDK